MIYYSEGDPLRRKRGVGARGLPLRADHAVGDLLLQLHPPGEHLGGAGKPLVILAVSSSSMWNDDVTMNSGSTASDKTLFINKSFVESHLGPHPLGGGRGFPLHASAGFAAPPLHGTGPQPLGPQGGRGDLPD